MPYQKGFIVTIRFMLVLVTDLLRVLGQVACLLSSRINQAILESFFGLVRGKGVASSQHTSVRVRPSAVSEV